MFRQPKNVEVVTNEQMRDWFPDPLKNHLPFPRLQEWMNHAEKFREDYEGLCQQFLESHWRKKFPNQYAVNVRSSGPSTGPSNEVDTESLQRGSDEEDDNVDSSPTIERKAEDGNTSSGTSILGILPEGLSFTFDRNQRRTSPSTLGNGVEGDYSRHERRETEYHS
jgi:hypothetical protein